jgi:hypothetical protein
MTTDSRKKELDTFFSEIYKTENVATIQEAFTVAKNRNKKMKTLKLADKKYLAALFNKKGHRRDGEEALQITLSDYKSTSRPRYSFSLNKNLPSRKSRRGLSSIKRPCNLHVFNKTNYVDIPLQIEISSQKCVDIVSEEGQRYLLKRLHHSKTLDLEHLITPKQYDNNCYFNTMLVILFISDKGREFFYFFRHLMIIGELANGDKIPDKLRNLFALFNFFIESFFSGSTEALDKLDTNVLIKGIHQNIGSSKETKSFVDVNKNSSTVLYINDMINYLSIESIVFAFLNSKNPLTFNQPPHMIMLLFPKNSKQKKEMFLRRNNYVYALDSASVLSFKGTKHFCACITCNNEDYIFDGNSHSRLHKMEWKTLMNDESNTFSFEPELNIQWNFMYSEVSLIYFRIQ